MIEFGSNHDIMAEARFGNRKVGGKRISRYLRRGPEFYKKQEFIVSNRVNKKDNGVLVQSGLPRLVFTEQNKGSNPLHAT